MKNALTLVSLLVVACSGEPFGTPLFVELDGDIVDVHQPELDAGDVLVVDAPELDAGDVLVDATPDAIEPVDAPGLDGGEDAGTPDSSAPDSGKPDSGKPDAGDGGGVLDCCGPSTCSNPTVHQCVCNFDVNCCATWDSICGTYVESQGCGECS